MLEINALFFFKMSKVLSSSSWGALGNELLVGGLFFATEDEVDDVEEDEGYSTGLAE